jgi:hypothetical protein
MREMKNFVCLLIVLVSGTVCSAHIRLRSPVPRVAGDGIKTGPCGGSVRQNVTVVDGGKMLTVSWEETINHPGRFILSFSNARDAFTGNILKTIIDNQGAETPTPHQFSTQIPIPDINCDTCSIQLIQSMEENPQAPTFYYSCADLKIVASASPANPTTTTTSTTTPTSITTSTTLPGALPPDVHTQGGLPNTRSSSLVPTAKFGGACGLVKKFHDSNDDGGNGAAGLWIFLPLLIWTGFRFSILAKLQIRSIS